MDKLRDESRRQFEAFYREEYLRGEEALTRSPVTGSYIYAHAQGHWKSWVRSRQSIVVDVPEVIGYGMINREELLAIIRSIGLSIKGE
ncbi:hypothetical protein [Serratia marcescens]|uniref:hypothetical protein n=1 Tax=Serratia marcescens TaxID=615 RepID=UPI002882BE3E|nr:hypothetical protein [Serratia marcescens]MDT0208489.1 hypothetical protein [Serratia marcescens]